MRRHQVPLPQTGISSDLYLVSPRPFCVRNAHSDCHCPVDAAACCMPVAILYFGEVNDASSVNCRSPNEKSPAGAQLQLLDTGTS